MFVWYKTGHLKRRSLPLPFCVLLSSNCSPMYLAVSGGVSSYSSSSTGIGLATPIRTLPERERIVSTGAITKHNANTEEACSVPWRAYTNQYDTLWSPFQCLNSIAEGGIFQIGVIDRHQSINWLQSSILFCHTSGYQTPNYNHCFFRRDWVLLMVTRLSEDYVRFTLQKVNFR